MRWVVALLLGIALSAAPAALGSTPEEATLAIDPDPSDAHVYLRGPDPRGEPLICTGRCTLRLPSGSFRIQAGMTHGSLGTAPDPLLLAVGDSRRIRVTVRENAPRMFGLLGLSVAGLGLLVAGAVQELARPGPDPWETRTLSGNSLVIAGAISALAAGALGALTDQYEVEIRPAIIPVVEGDP